MKTALSFAERSLQHKEDMETLSLCTQATAQLIQLDKLEWDSQSTESIEASGTQWEPDPLGRNIVGTLPSVTCAPELQITADNTLNSVFRGYTVEFNVTAAFNILPNMVHSYAEANRPITLSVKAFYDGIRKSKQIYEVTVKKISSHNWKVSFQPSHGTHTILVEITARGEYGQRTTSKTVEYTIQAQIQYRDLSFLL